MPTAEDYLGTFMDEVLGLVTGSRSEMSTEIDPETGAMIAPAGVTRFDEGSPPDAGPSGPLDWGGFQNGRIPAERLTEIESGVHRLETASASAWNRMKADAADDGVTLDLTDSYRSFDAQVSVRRRKGGQVATADPGTSVHGWGKAIDVASEPARQWIQKNGSKYGWIWPQWARQKGTKKYEPWHFEFRGMVADG